MRIQDYHFVLHLNCCVQVLMQSFMRADRLAEEGLAVEARALVQKYASSLSADPEVSLSSIFTARQGEFDCICCLFAETTGYLKQSN